MGDNTKVADALHRNTNQSIERGAKAQQDKPSAGSPQKSGRSKKVDAAKKKASKSFGETVQGWWGEFRQYFSEVTFELRKVVWPSRKETIGSTAVVLVVVALAGVFLGAVDMVLSRLIRLVVG